MAPNPSLPHWTTKLSVGIEEIDNQHQTLCQLIGDIHRAIDKRKDTSILDDLLGQLASYTRIHFSVEESLMRSLNYPGYEQHKKTHEALLDECLHIRGQIQSGKMTRTELLDFLGGWFTEHILKDDLDYSEHFHRAGANDALQRMNWMSHLWQWHSNP